MKYQALKQLIKEEVRKVLKENNTEIAPSKPKTSPTTKPGTTEKPKKRRPLGNPNVSPKPKAESMGNEDEIVKKITNRYKTLK